MRVVLILVALLVGSVVALAEEKTTCVEFNGVEFCETTTILKFGDKEVPVDDPFALLNSIGKSQVEKVGLWEVYKYPPVIVELASQVSMEEDDLIYYLRTANDSWAALYELTEKYEELSAKVLRLSNSDTVDKLFKHILDDITEDIKEQLKEFDGEEV